MGKQAGRRGKQRRSKTECLKGTKLFRDPKSGLLYWRRVDPETGKRVTRATGERTVRRARRKTPKWEEEFDKKEQGIKTHDCWGKELRPLAQDWIAACRSEPEHRRHSQRWLAQQKSAIERALRDLDLEKAADLTHLGRLESKLRGLGKSESVMRRGYQVVLKSFSKWLAGNHRHLSEDPLTSWQPISYQKSKPHRCYEPDQVARALVASDWIDEIRGRRYRLRTVLSTALVTMSRADAFTSREVEDYLRDERRLDFGAGQGNKGRGQGRLDKTTAGELEVYIGDRLTGPLFLGERGGRLSSRRLLAQWKEAYGLGVLAEIWPAETPWCRETAFHVNQALSTGRPKVGGAGNPRLVRPATRNAWKAREREIAALADPLRDVWNAHMERVTIHSFRHTHQTWALAARVPQHLVNLQAGWKVGTEDLTVKRIRSITGLQHYVDTSSSLLDSRESAEAVREMLDKAMESVETKLAGLVAGSHNEASGTAESHGTQRRA